MANHDPTLEDLASEMAELRAALARQQQITLQQQEALNALQQELRLKSAAPTAPVAAAPVTPVIVDAPATPHGAAHDAHDAHDAPPQAQRSTSRRGLLRGAAAATAAAAVAAVAVGGAEQAHAAPLTSGGNFILGQTNDADAPTILVPTFASTPFPLMRVDNSATINPSLEVWGNAGLGAINVSGGTGTGIWVNSGAGDAVFGNSSSGLSINAAGAGRIAQNPQATAGAPTGGSHYIGEQIRDSNGELWICTANGTPGTWGRVPHVSPGATGGAISFLSAPMRLLDTRGPGYPAYYNYGSHSPLGAGDHKFYVSGDVYNSITVPSNATGVIGNVTIVNPNAAGFVSIFPANISFPGTANLAFSPGQVLSNSFTSGVGFFTIFIFSGYGIDVYLSSGVTTDVIVDLFAVTL